MCEKVVGSENIKLYEVFRELIRAEVDWIKHRMQWLGTTQALLLGAFGLLMKENVTAPQTNLSVIILLICVSGVLSSFFLLKGLQAARGVILSIADEWNKLLPEKARKALPSLRFPSKHGGNARLSTIGVAYLFIFIWIILSISILGQIFKQLC